ncbi:MAG: SprT-like domain-containing protein [Candidatus Altiarchaeota archaeon]|nr:SprT-like domain-containing protein [Candidatus Altiarchaeota archaeon]
MDSMEVDDSTLIGLISREFDRLNTQHFGGSIPMYRFRISRYSARTHGRIDFSKREIMLSLNLYLQHGWDAVVQTLLHEMTHAYLHELGGRSNHTQRFWREFTKRGGVRDKIDVKPKSCYLYACSTCGAEYERMRCMKKPWLHSCPRCDKKYNPLHKLYLKKDKVTNP